MKLGLSPLLFTLTCVLVLGLLASTARAFGPRRSVPLEDALEDGEIDSEDIATRPPPAGGAGSAVLGRPRGAAYVSLVGFSRRNVVYDEREVGGFVVLGVPFDRLASGGRATTAFGPEAELASTLQPAGANDAPFELGLSSPLARACVTEAWRSAGIGVDDARLDAIMTRARWSATLPEARLRAVRFDDARLSLDSGTDTSRLRDSAGANVGFEARLTWRLDRLIYADDEPAFERIRLEHRDARGRIAARVLEALFHWQRAALDLRTLPPSQVGTRDEADVVLRALEAEATLDVLTNGWFGTHKPRSRAPASTPPGAGHGI